jgi:MFS transporter, DHA2 family, multidrug resistance protein
VNAQAPAPAPAPTPRPLVGVGALLLGAVISTLYSRVTGFGLADIRGAVGAGFDEGSWIATASTVGQMLMAVLTLWLGAAFGARRVLFYGTAVFAVACLLIPFAPDVKTLIFLQFIAGMGSGTYVPLAIIIVLRYLKPGWQTFGMAAYAMSFELSQNIPASLEGFYLDHLSWRWIFWQQDALAPLMLLLVYFGIPREPVNHQVLKNNDLPGMIYLGVGMSVLTAALDQGERLDWLGSGQFLGLLLSGMFLLAMFVWRELTTTMPFFDLRFAVRSVLPKAALVLILYRALVLATALIVPQYLTIIQGLRALQVGDTLIWIAIPQVVIAPLVGLVLLRVDARFVLAIGYATIGTACLMVATQLTADWTSDDFLPSQLVEALGQTCALTAFVWFVTRHIDPLRALTFGVFLQTFRLFGGELGTAFMSWFLRAREQTHSLLLGAQVQTGAFLAQAHLTGSAAALQPRASGHGGAQAEAAALLAQSVRTQSYLLTYIDAMTLLAMVAAAGLLVIATLRAAPNTALAVPAPPARAAVVP